MSTIFTFPSNTIGGGGSSGGGSGLEVSDSQTADFTALPNTAHPVDTSSAIVSATLPSAPEEGTRVAFFDIVGGADTNNPSGFGKNELHIYPGGGDTIIGEDDYFILTADNESLALVYNGGRWSISGGIKAQYSYTIYDEDYEYIKAQFFSNQHSGL